MPTTLTGPAQYFATFGEQTIAGSQYALEKLGVDRAHCSLKIEGNIILCIPYRLGFKRSIFMAALSKQELVFFQKYSKSTIGLSIALNPDHRPEPIKFFLHCTLTTLGQMKGRENVGLFVLDYKQSPDMMVTILGRFLENQVRLKSQYDDYGNKLIKITPDTAKRLGYNMYAAITEAGAAPRRIQVFALNTKSLEHLEAADAPLREPGTAVSYQLYFKKYRASLRGTIVSAETLPQGIIRTAANLEYSPELVEILDGYWYKSQTDAAQSAAS